MTKFLLRSWAEQTMFACREYAVEADSLKQAVALLHAMQERANETEKDLHDERVVAIEEYDGDEVRMLDPEQIEYAQDGITLIDESGERVRDLLGVPSGCDRLGEPLDE